MSADRPMYRCPACKEWAVPRQRLGYVDYDETRCQACGASLHIDFQAQTINGHAMSRQQLLDAWTGYYTGKGGRTRDQAREQAREQIKHLNFVKKSRRSASSADR